MVDKESKTKNKKPTMKEIRERTKNQRSRLSASLKSGGRIKHGGYSFMQTGRLPESRKAVARYLTGVRQGLIEDLGPTEDQISTARLVLIDRVVTKLGVLRCLEVHVAENSSVITKNDLNHLLGRYYLAYANSVRRDLEVLGVDRQRADQTLTPLQIAAEYDKEDKTG